MLREHSEALLLRELEAEVRKHLSRHMPPAEVSVTFGGGGSRSSAACSAGGFPPQRLRRGKIARGFSGLRDTSRPQTETQPTRPTASTAATSAFPAGKLLTPRAKVLGVDEKPTPDFRPPVMLGQADSRGWRTETYAPNDGDALTYIYQPEMSIGQLANENRELESPHRKALGSGKTHRNASARKSSMADEEGGETGQQEQEQADLQEGEESWPRDAAADAGGGGADSKIEIAVNLRSAHGNLPEPGDLEGGIPGTACVESMMSASHVDGGGGPADVPTGTGTNPKGHTSVTSISDESSHSLSHLHSTLLLLTGPPRPHQPSPPHAPAKTFWAGNVAQVHTQTYKLHILIS